MLGQVSDFFGGRLLPGQLLAITAVLYGRCPQASILLVPALRFDLGESLSAPVRARLPEARGLIDAWRDA